MDKIDIKSPQTTNGDYLIKAYDSVMQARRGKAQ